MTIRLQLPALLLVDLSSVAPKVRTKADVQDACELVRDLTVETLFRAERKSDVLDVDLRYYGGFFAHDGTSTSQYSFLISSLALNRGLYEGLRIKPVAVAALACSPGAKLIGTYRDGRQRMVDQMLAQDALYLKNRYCHIGIIADDEDYFPAILSLALASGPPVTWIRQRQLGRNDAHLDKSKVSMVRSPRWP